jgi:hypothetical protein
VASADTHNDTTTVSYKGAPLPYGQTWPTPGLMCPPDHPYVLRQRYNTDTSFRLDYGIEFTNWSWGFDAHVGGDKAYHTQESPEGRWVRTGLIGNTLLSDITYWWPSPPETNWTMNLHCTSNLKKASFNG